MNIEQDNQASKKFKIGESDVSFQESKIEESHYDKNPKIIQWVVKYSGGLIKDEKQASYVLLGFVVIAVIATLFLVFGGNRKVESPNSDIINRPQSREGYIPR